MLITKEIDHAIKCVLHLSIDQFGYISAADLSTKLMIPREFLSKILQKLVKSGIVKSFQGMRGGYKLGKSPEAITLWDIFDAFHTLPVVYKCVTNDFTCERRSYCATRPVWAELLNHIVQRLKSIRFSDLAKNQIDYMHHMALGIPFFPMPPLSDPTTVQKEKILPISLKENSSETIKSSTP